MTGPILGLRFMKNNSVVVDTTDGLVQFPYLTMQAKNAASKTSAKPQPVLIHDSVTVPPRTPKTVTAYFDHPLKWHTTGTVRPVKNFTKAVSLLKSQSMSTIIDQKTAVKIINTRGLPYSMKKNTQTAELSVVTPEQSNFIKPVDKAILSMIPEGDPDLTTYLSEILRTIKTEQEHNAFWFPTPENFDKTEDLTPIHTRIVRELRELQEKEKLNPEDDVESRMKFLERFDWTDALLTATEKNAVEDILVEYHDKFARHRIDIGMNTGFRVRLTSKDDKAAYSQSLPRPIQLEED